MINRPRKYLGWKTPYEVFYENKLDNSRYKKRLKGVEVTIKISIYGPINRNKIHLVKDDQRRDQMALTLVQIIPDSTNK